MALVPVPIEFQLPDGWASADREQVAASGAAYVALRTGLTGPFTPNITVTADYREDDVSMPAIADEIVERLRRTARDVQLMARRTVGDDHVPGVIQSVTLTLVVGDRPLHLAQVQAVLAFRDELDPGRRAIYLFALTAARAHLDVVLPEFQQYVRSVRVPQHHDETAGSQGA